MTSARKIAANRKNARASRGPKTAEGKARVAKNGLRHGLSTLIASDPALSKEADMLARGIAGDTEDPRILPLARTIAEAQIAVARVRQARQQLMSMHIKQPELDAISSQPQSPDDRLTTAIRELAPQLIKMDRYERRALSRRKFAIRKLDRMRKDRSI